MHSEITSIDNNTNKMDENVMEENVITEKVMTENTDSLKWDDFGFNTQLLRGIYCMGFENPSSIQQKAIKPMLTGSDLIAQAQSGTGKTGTFSISILQLIDPSVSTTQAIVLSPTHELAIQSATVIKNIGAMMKNVVVQTLIGGSSVYDDTQSLKNTPPHIIVGTPGRVYDMIKRNFLNTENIKVFVLDEADDMLSSGFKDQIYNIFQHLPNQVQVALFSATMPPEILELTKKFMKNPIKIIMKTEELNLECIQQYYIAIQSDKEKYTMLKQLFEYLSVSQCIIYVNSVKRVMDLYNAMIEEGFSVCSIHSSMTKTERDQSFVQFKNGVYRILISSNITARGIDIQQVSIVINFDIPNCVHTYLHRIGRSGRWGRKGTAINFVTRRDIHYMKNIEQHYKSNIAEFPLNENIGKTLNKY